MVHLVMLLTISMLVACSQDKKKELPFFKSPDFNPIWLSEGGDTSNMHRIGSFSFINQNGEEITEADYKDKIYVTNFVFTTCGSICPKMTNHMKGVQEALKNHQDELLFLSHSVMPWVDSPEKLKAYARQMKADERNWHFVTGNKADIYRIARQEYFIEEEPGYTKDSTEFLHTEHFALVDKESRIRGIYNGTLELEMKNLIEDIQILLEESSYE